MSFSFGEIWQHMGLPAMIVAAVLVRPDKDLAGVQVKSLKKRWKEKAFARGADRDQMAGHEALSLERDEFLEIALTASRIEAGDEPLIFCLASAR